MPQGSDEDPVRLPEAIPGREECEGKDRPVERLSLGSEGDRFIAVPAAFPGQLLPAVP